MNLGSGQTQQSILRLPCYADTMNNTGYLLRPNCIGPDSVSAVTPSAQFNLSGKDTCVTAPIVWNLTGTVAGQPDSVVIISDLGRVGRATISNNAFSFNWQMPNNLETYYLTAAVYKNNALIPVSWTESFKPKLNNVCPTVTSLKKQQNISKNVFQVYPNPAQDKLYINSLNFSGAAQLQLITMTGQTVAQKMITVGNEATELNINHLPKGIYLLRLQTAQQTITQKVVKQ